MSACYVCSVLELPKIKGEPNWESARVYIRGLSEVELAQKFIAGLMLDINDELSEDETSNQAMVDAVVIDLGFGSSTLQKVAQNSIDECENMWDGNSEGGSITLSNCQILVAGESSYGDEPDGVGSINRFAACGAAKAAGFLVD